MLLILSLRGAKRRSNLSDLCIEVVPGWVHGFYGSNLLFAGTTFELFLTLNRADDVRAHLVVDQSIDVIFLRKLASEFVFVFVYALFKVAGDARIEYRTCPVGENVNVTCLFHEKYYEMYFESAQVS